MAEVPVDAASGMDHADVHLMAAHVCLATGLLTEGRRHADALAALPFLREEPQIGLARQLELGALAGSFDEVAAQARAFRTSWERAGRPVVNNFAPASYAVAMVLRRPRRRARRAPSGRRSRGAWPASPAAATTRRSSGRPCWTGCTCCTATRPSAPTSLLSFAPDEVPGGCRWHQRLWLPWYAGLWAEAGALTGAADLDDRLVRAAAAARGNEVAGLLVDRAALVASGDADALGPP